MNRSATYHLGRLLAAVPIGMAGGVLAGLAIVFLASPGWLATGRSAVGLSLISTGLYAAFYGAIVGAVAVPIAYVVVLHKIGFMIAAVPAFVGTVAGGLVAVLLDPEAVFGFALVGFAASLYATWFRYQRVDSPRAAEGHQNGRSR